MNSRRTPHTPRKIERDYQLPLLVTKLHVPGVRERWVARGRLLARLAARPACGLVIISAPAGYGKTSLLADWIRALGQESPAPALAWLSLDESDNNPIQFWNGVAAALQRLPAFLRAGQALAERLEPELFELPVDLDRLPGPAALPLENTLRLFINDLAGLAEPLVLVLDDYHVVTASSVHESMAFLLSHLPPRLCLVISSRSDPTLAALPVPLLRARGQVLELTAADLRFTPEEAARFLSDVMELHLSPQDAAFLENQTEGWAAGLQLAALSLQGSQTLQKVEHFSGSDRYVLDYLTQEVLDRQPPQIKDFLLHTAILTRLTAPLCDELTGEPSRAAGQSQSILERLEAANLFVVPLDRQRRWYRYHHLFAELLRDQLARLSPDLLPELHRRAARWHWEHGFYTEAIEHALQADPELAAGWIEDISVEIELRMDTETLLGWLGALPPGLVAARPGLCMAQAWVDLIQFRYAACEVRLAQVEQAVDRLGGDPALRGQAAAVHSTLEIARGDHQRALEYARLALADLPPHLERLRALIQLDIGDALQGIDAPTAKQALRQAVEISQEWDHPSFRMICTGSLVNTLFSQGRLREAEAEFQAAQAEERAWIAQGHNPLDESGKLLALYANVLYERDELEQARDLARESITRCERWGHLKHQVDGWVALARASHALGDTAEAEMALAKARAAVPREYLHPEQADALPWRTKLLYKLGQVDYAEAFFAYIEGREAWLDRWAAERGLNLAAPTPGAAGRDLYLYARILVRRGGEAQAQAVLSLLQPLYEDARRQDLRLREATLCLLKACACRALGRPGEALAAIHRAVTLCVEEGCRRLFLDTGRPAAEVLQFLLDEGRPEEPVRTYAGDLLARFRPGQRQPGAQQIEPLTHRELDVLRLLSTGRSNAEIAAALFVSDNTVKTHIRHIYEKLQAGNRVELVETARKMGLV